MQEFDQLVKTIKILRSPKGCPWDKAQKVANYKKYLLEEAYELVEAIYKKDSFHVKEELGDLFLILVAISGMYQEKNVFSLKDVLKEINQKLIVRHPHVFSTKKLKTKEEVYAHWVQQKAKQKNRKTIQERLPKTAPALLLADIFFKEQRRGKKMTKQDKTRQISQALDVLREFVKDFSRKANKESTLLKALIAFCSIAYLYNVNLEGLLRINLFEKAAKTSY